MYQPIKFFAHNSESIKTIKSLGSILENLKNIVSFTRFFEKLICTHHHNTEKNGTGVTLKWKRENHISIYGYKTVKRDFLRVCGKSLFDFKRDKN
jgi:hypothetical protein